MSNETESGATTATDTTVTTGADTASSTATDSQASTDSAKVEGQGEAGKTGEATTGDAATDKTAQAGDGKAGEGEGGKTTAAVPEKYEVPEGYTIEAHDLPGVTELARERGYTQEQFNEMVKAGSELRLQAAIRQTEAWGQQSRESLGDKYDATVEQAKGGLAPLKAENPALFEEAMKAFAGPVNEDGTPNPGGLGWGNHPALLRVFAYFGSKLQEGGMHGLGGQTADTTPKTMGERMYPNMK